jgi:hypothetical protein
MDWLAFTGIFILGGLTGIFLMGLFVGAVSGFPQPPGLEEKESTSSHRHLAFPRTVESATYHLHSSETAETLSQDLEGHSRGREESRIRC